MRQSTKWNACEFYVLDPTEVEAFARAAESDQDAALFRVAAFTGLRLGELRALRWGDVDFSKRLVHVRRNFTHGAEGSPKSGRVRSVPLIDQAATALALGELRDEVDPAANLERPDRLMVLVLDPHLGPNELVECGVAVERGRRKIRGDPLPCRKDVSESRRLGSHEQTLPQEPLDIDSVPKRRIFPDLDPGRHETREPTEMFWKRAAAVAVLLAAVLFAVITASASSAVITASASSSVTLARQGVAPRCRAVNVVGLTGVAASALLRARGCTPGSARNGRHYVVVKVCRPTANFGLVVAQSATGRRLGPKERLILRVGIRRTADGRICGELNPDPGQPPPAQPPRAADYTGEYDFTFTVTESTNPLATIGQRLIGLRFTVAPGGPAIRGDMGGLVNADGTVTNMFLVLDAFQTHNHHVCPGNLTFTVNGNNVTVTGVATCMEGRITVKGNVDGNRL